MAVALAALAVGSLPWLIPSVLHTVYADPAGVAAFAARADTPFGTVGSLVMLGGTWNATTVPKAYGGPVVRHLAGARAGRPRRLRAARPSAAIAGRGSRRARSRAW